MLSNPETVELKSVFLNPSTGRPKRIECIRVDGASDEGPSHDEVKFWWAARHLEHARLVTLVSSRSSGCSYLNRVELQNGCLSLGHANLFIPSTLGGSVFNPDTGEIDMNKVKNNLDLATSVYIERVNNCPCGETVIHLYRGADSSNLQQKRDHLLVYLKGSKKKREQLQRDKPDLYAYFQTVWEMKKRHEISGLPLNYLYLLVCCFKDGCPHPICQSGVEGMSMQWYQDGPHVNTIPFPVPDPAQPWGSTTCTKCPGFCAGHYLKAEEAVKSSAVPAKQPPSMVLKEFFLKHGDNPSEAHLENVAKETLLSVNEVQLWMQHLKTVDDNRKRGAAKAARTRQNKKNQTATYCGVCEGLFEECTDEVEYWICCDKCNTWFHGDCVNITAETEPDNFYCDPCSMS